MLCRLVLRSLASGFALMAFLNAAASPAADRALPQTVEIMSVDDVREGMEGTGKTCLQGTELVPFDVKILGVLKGVAPGRDIVLARFSGSKLEYTGVIAGMSGSPVYINGKLLGAVAYTWSFNKEPIGGITPFEQMRTFADRKPAGRPVQTAIQATADGAMPMAALDISRDPFTHLEAAATHSATAVAARSGGMTPIAIPLAASGFSSRSLDDLHRYLKPLGMLPMAGGAASAAAKASEPANPIVPGASLGASLITGDFDLSGLGTVTHVEGNQVWGWGHPFMESGNSQYLLRSGYIHVVNPKFDVSTKMGSPLSVLGVINSDVSTCIAGELGAKADMLPVTITLQQGPAGEKKQYKVEVVRQADLLAPMIATVLSNALDAGGNLDQEITLSMEASIQAQGLEPIRFKNTYSGGSVAGSQGAKGLLNQIATVADGLTRNPFSCARLESIECHAVVTDKRTSAAITNVRLNSDRYEPGDNLTATVTLRPYKCDPVSIDIKLTLPKELPTGSYSAVICDSPNHLRSIFQEEPNVMVARNVNEIAHAFRLQLEEKRETLYLRVLTPDTGLAVDRVTLPQLPASVRTAFESRRSTPGMSLRRALVSRQSTPWVVEGNTNLRFTVVADKRVSEETE